MEHELKIWPKYYEDTASGAKSFEYRNLDRDFQVNDTLWLREWDRSVPENYTGRSFRAAITYVLRPGAGDPFLFPWDYCILGIKPFIGSQA